MFSEARAHIARSSDREIAGSRWAPDTDYGRHPAPPGSAGGVRSGNNIAHAGQFRKKKRASSLILPMSCPPRLLPPKENDATDSLKTESTG